MPVTPGMAAPPTTTMLTQPAAHPAVKPYQFAPLPTAADTLHHHTTTVITTHLHHTLTPPPPHQHDTSDALSSASSTDDDLHAKHDRTFVPWSDRTPTYLARYHTDRPISITQDWHPITHTTDTTTPASMQYIFDASKPVTDQKQARISTFYRVEDHKACNQKAYVTSAQFTTTLTDLTHTLHTLWHHKQRIHCLQLVIHMASHMTDTDVLEFYPHKFIRITDTANTFSDLIYRRVLHKHDTAAAPSAAVLPETYSSADVSAQVTETALNYLYRIYEIRNNYIRLFIEISLLRLYRFIYKPADIPEKLQYLSRAIRSVGDVVAAAYLRLYLTERLVSLALSYQTKSAASPVKPKIMLRSFYPIVVDNYNDLVDRLYKHSTAELNAVLYPVHDYMLDVIGMHSKSVDYTHIYDLYRAKCHQSYDVLYCLIKYFHTAIIGSNCVELMDCIVEYFEVDNTALAALLIKFGKKLQRAQLSHQSADKNFHLINTAYRLIDKQAQLTVYLQLNVVYVPLLVQTMHKREVGIFLSTLYQRIKVDRAARRSPDDEHLYDICANLLTAKNVSHMLRHETYKKIVTYLSDQNRLKLYAYTLHYIGKHSVQLREVTVLQQVIMMAATLQQADQLDDSTLVKCIQLIQSGESDAFADKYNCIIQLQPFCKSNSNTAFALVCKLQQLCYKASKHDNEVNVVVSNVFAMKANVTQPAQHVALLQQSMCLLIRHNMLTELYVKHVKYTCNYVFSHASEIDVLSIVPFMSCAIPLAKATGKPALYFVNTYMSSCLALSQWSDSPADTDKATTALTSLYQLIAYVISTAQLTPEDVNELHSWLHSTNGLCMSALKRQSGDKQTPYVCNILSTLTSTYEVNESLQLFIVQLLWQLYSTCAAVDKSMVREHIQSIQHHNAAFSQALADKFLA